MFAAARLKLTFYYLLIIMCISVLFSLVVYRSAIFEVHRSLELQALRFHLRIEPAVFDEASLRIAQGLGLINLGILVLSGAAAYFLSGQTLEPIETMVEDQRRFIADASHELRTPLTAMKTETEVALRCEKISSKEALQLLGSNLEEINKLQSLSNYLLSLARYENPESILALNEVDLSELAREAIERVRALAKKNKIELTTSLSHVLVSGNETSMVEAMVILLDNAIKYSHTSGKVAVATKREKNLAIFSVQDFGVGIKTSDAPYIFKRFYRSDASRSKSTSEGYGLGLAIAQSIVGLHHGKIKVISRESEGSTFIIMLTALAK